MNSRATGDNDAAACHAARATNLLKSPTLAAPAFFRRFVLLSIHFAITT